MARKNIFAGIFGVMFVAIIIFFGIYFLYPDVSMKYFGTAFDAKALGRRVVSSLVVDSDYLTIAEKQEVEEILSSKEAEEAMKVLADAAKDGEEAVQSALEDDALKGLWKKLEGIVSPENLEKFIGEAETQASSVYERLFK